MHCNALSLPAAQVPVFSNPLPYLYNISGSCTELMNRGNILENTLQFTEHICHDSRLSRLHSMLTDDDNEHCDVFNTMRYFAGLNGHDTDNDARVDENDTDNGGYNRFDQSEHTKAIYDSCGVEQLQHCSVNQSLQRRLEAEIWAWFPKFSMRKLGRWSKTPDNILLLSTRVCFILSRVLHALLDMDDKHRETSFLKRIFMLAQVGWELSNLGLPQPTEIKGKKSGPWIRMDRKVLPTRIKWRYVTTLYICKVPNIISQLLRQFDVSLHDSEMVSEYIKNALLVDSNIYYSQAGGANGKPSNVSRFYNDISKGMHIFNQNRRKVLDMTMAFVFSTISRTEGRLIHPFVYPHKPENTSETDERKFQTELFSFVLNVERTFGVAKTSSFWPQTEGPLVNPERLVRGGVTHEEKNKECEPKDKKCEPDSLLSEYNAFVAASFLLHVGGSDTEDFPWKQYMEDGDGGVDDTDRYPPFVPDVFSKRVMVTQRHVTRMQYLQITRQECLDGFEYSDACVHNIQKFFQENFRVAGKAIRIRNHVEATAIAIKVFTHDLHILHASGKYGLTWSEFTHDILSKGSTNTTKEDVLDFLSCLFRFAASECLKQMLRFVQFSRHTNPSEVALLLPYIHYSLVHSTDAAKQIRPILDWIRKCMHTPRLLRKGDEGRLEFSVRGSGLHFLVHPCTTEWLFRVCHGTDSFTLNPTLHEMTKDCLFSERNLGIWKWMRDPVNTYNAKSFNDMLFPAPEWHYAIAYGQHALIGRQWLYFHVAYTTLLSELADSTAMYSR